MLETVMPIPLALVVLEAVRISGFNLLLIVIFAVLLLAILAGAFGYRGRHHH